jgi:hypothetical protein
VNRHARPNVTITGESPPTSRPTENETALGRAGQGIVPPAVGHRNAAGADPYLLMGLTAVHLDSMVSGRKKVTIVWTLASVAFVAVIDKTWTILGFGSPARHVTNGLPIFAASAVGVRRRRQS